MEHIDPYMQAIEETEFTWTHKEAFDILKAEYRDLLYEVTQSLGDRIQKKHERNVYDKVVDEVAEKVAASLWDVHSNIDKRELVGTLNNYASLQRGSLKKKLMQE